MALDLNATRAWDDIKNNTWIDESDFDDNVDFEQISLAITLIHLGLYLSLLLIVSIISAFGVRKEMKAMKKAKKGNKNQIQTEMAMPTHGTTIVTDVASIIVVTDETLTTNNDTNNETMGNTKESKDCQELMTSVTTQNDKNDSDDENDYKDRKIKNDQKLTQINPDVSYVLYANQKAWKWHTPLTKWYKSVQQKRRVYLSLVPHIIDQAVSKTICICFVLLMNL